MDQNSAVSKDEVTQNGDLQFRTEAYLPPCHHYCQRGLRRREERRKIIPTYSNKELCAENGIAFIDTMGIPQMLHLDQLIVQLWLSLETDQARDLSVSEKQCPAVMVEARWYYWISCWPDNWGLGYASCLSKRMAAFQKGKWVGQGLITSDDDQLYGLRRYWTTITRDNAKKLIRYLICIKSDRDLTLSDNGRTTKLSSKFEMLMYGTRNCYGMWKGKTGA
ncbi:hypothetical protein llap_10764 [Limosa lapponica baueri]|uniref:Uncharacterized protein n=1 Tax=Limosa lapponica baueri TaxID=1758121 RepID=A0A2I0TYU6_LIMLA|nr:hypothetical protein llap_10764 [Limosa lapponica baueri]